MGTKSGFVQCLFSLKLNISTGKTRGYTGTHNSLIRAQFTHLPHTHLHTPTCIANAHTQIQHIQT